MSHTPGPYAVRFERDGCNIYSPECFGVSVAWLGVSTIACASGSYHVSAEECHSNGRLLSSAPELLTMLKALLECTKEQLETIRTCQADIDRSASRRSRSPQADPPLLALVQQVINKAEGKTPL